MPLRPIPRAVALTFGAVLAAAAARAMRRKPAPCDLPHYVQVDTSKMTYNDLPASKQDVSELRAVLAMHSERIEAHDRRLATLEKR